jgi:hypothetical protein
MKITSRFLLYSVLILGGLACTPKVITEVVPSEEEPKVVIPKEESLEALSPCPKFSDAANSDELETAYVLYRDFMKSGDWEEAFRLWSKVYQAAPAADGRRNTVYADGIRFYERKYTQVTDAEIKERLIDTIFSIYDAIDECYGEGGYIPARKAFDLYYKYPHRASPKQILDLFIQAIEIDDLNTPDFVINPFTALLVELYFEDEIDMTFAAPYAYKVLDILENGLSKCEGVDCDRWDIVASYAPANLEAFEAVKGFYDCDYYYKKYYQDFLDAQENCEIVRTVYSRLKWGNCPELDERFQNLIAVGNTNCAPEPGPIEVAYDCLKNADYNCAIDGFQTAAAATDDLEKKSRYLMLVAKIYQTHLKNFAQSRKFALQAAEIRPNWGEPFLHIGRLYASSGPLCGPGRGWDSQVVVWPAVDMWLKAKKVDPSVTSEANEWIARYSQYMPEIGDIFQRNLQEGTSFTVGCWIQETTIIRAARK